MCISKKCKVAMQQTEIILKDGRFLDGYLFKSKVFDVFN